MHPAVESKREEIIALCRQVGVLRLDVFGSAVSDDFDVEHSDVDVLVDFDSEVGGGLRRYFALKDGLEQILGRPVDVISAGSIRNPYVDAQVSATREPFYVA